MAACREFVWTVAVVQNDVCSHVMKSINVMKKHVVKTLQLYVDLPLSQKSTTFVFFRPV